MDNGKLASMLTDVLSLDLSAPLVESSSLRGISMYAGFTCSLSIAALLDTGEPQVSSVFKASLQGCELSLASLLSPVSANDRTKHVLI